MLPEQKMLDLQVYPNSQPTQVHHYHGLLSEPLDVEKWLLHKAKYVKTSTKFSCENVTSNPSDQLIVQKRILLIP